MIVPVNCPEPKSPNSLPQVFAPLVAAPVVLYLGGYTALFVLAAVVGLLGAVFVVKIKGVQ